LQRYIKSQALSHGTAVVDNHDFDRALASVIDLVMERATEHAAQHRVPVNAGGGGGA
jgi:2-phosphoglycerate kinase